MEIGKEVAIEGLRFLRGTRCILDIDALRLPAGRTTAILGPNGAGKSTLLRLLCGLERPAAGRVLVGDRPVSVPPSRGDVAIAFQQPVLIAGSVADNLELGLRLRGLGPGERRARIAEVARELDIEHLLERAAKRLSRGEAQRISLARALSLRAPLTLLDEPLSGLDAAVRRTLLDELPSLLAARGTTAVVVTHDREEAIQLADHLVVLVEGRARVAAPLGHALRHPPDAEVARLLGYLVLRLDDDCVAIPPGGLRLGEGTPAIELVVERVIETATGLEATGRIRGQRAKVALPAGHPPPAPGERLPVALDHALRLQAKPET